MSGRTRNPRSSPAVADKVKRRLSYAKHRPPGLGLMPLRLEDRAVWNPNEGYWGEEDLGTAKQDGDNRHDPPKARFMLRLAPISGVESRPEWVSSACQKVQVLTRRIHGHTSSMSPGTHCHMVSCLSPGSSPADQR